MLPNQLVEGWTLPVNFSPTQIFFYNAQNASIVTLLNWSRCWGPQWRFSQTRPCLRGTDLSEGESVVETDHTSSSQYNQTQRPLCNSNLLNDSFIILKLNSQIIHYTYLHNVKNQYSIFTVIWWRNESNCNKIICISLFKCLVISTWESMKHSDAYTYL